MAFGRTCENNQRCKVFEKAIMQYLFVKPDYIWQKYISIGNGIK